ncbi:MAG: glycosyltransferase family 39 protein [Sandaracinus sp.]
MSSPPSPAEPSRPAALRGLLALALVGLAGALAWPGDAPPRSTTWSELLAPVAGGTPVAGHTLASIRRGEEHDVVLTLRETGGEGAIEVHVLDRGRWPGVRETESFGVAYEAPLSSSRAEACERVTEEVAAALRAHDPGGLGPVDVIPIASEPAPPAIARALDRVAGVRGAAIGLALAGASWLLGSLPCGAALGALWLFLLGLALRVPALDVPFVRDQDVQRIFTGHLPLSEILTGRGLTDRHPPLYFLVLHGAQLFGQGEAATRAPAVLAGALVGPAVVVATRTLGRAPSAGVLAGLAATVSVELIVRSREVSSLPLLSLLLLALVVTLVRHTERPSRTDAVGIAGSIALALGTHHVALFALLGALLGLAAARKLSRAVARPVLAGLLLGAPALVLAAATLARDRDARLAAELHPGLAWGSHDVLGMGVQLVSLAASAVGPALALLFVLGAAWATARRDATVLVPAAAAIASVLGIACLAPVARVQPYYLVGALPLVPLALGLAATLPFSPTRPWLALAALSTSVALGTIPSLHEARGAYLADPDAFVPALARAIASGPERRVALVVEYDAPLLAYYLARPGRVPMDWDRMREDEDGTIHLEGLPQQLLPLVRSHAIDADPDTTALAALRRARARGPLLVVSREAFRLPRTERALEDECTVRMRAGTGTLHACP